MVERSLSMREVPGSMPGSSITLFTQLTTFTICVNELHQPQHVRMAERSKAPDSRVTSLPLTTKEHSGPRMWAWVRIPLLTELLPFPTSWHSSANWSHYALMNRPHIRIHSKSIISPTGNRTPVSRVTGGDTYHYTTEDISLHKFSIFYCIIDVRTV